jgi:GT2 family glycosyltransferase
MTDSRTVSSDQRSEVQTCNIQQGGKSGSPVRAPRVSIGMPLYNAERYLAGTLESILGQTFCDLEVVISDNGSTDRTEQICRQYASRDNRIRYYRNEVNRGAAWNYNHVFELARGEYFKWASYDDLLAPKFLEHCVASLDQDPSAALAFTQFLDDDEGRSFRERRPYACQFQRPHRRLRNAGPAAGALHSPRLEDEPDGRVTHVDNREPLLVVAAEHGNARQKAAHA